MRTNLWIGALAAQSSVLRADLQRGSGDPCGLQSRVEATDKKYDLTKAKAA